MSPEELTALIVEDHPQRRAERAALANGRWGEFLAGREPEPTGFHPLKRRAWKEAIDKAVSLGQSTLQREVLVFGVWVNDNDSDQPGTNWLEQVVIQVADDFPHLRDDLTCAEVVLATVEEQRLGWVSAADRYSKRFPTVLRNADYLVYEAKRLERVVAVTQSFQPARRPAPERAIPANGCDVRALGDVAGLPAALSGRMEAAMEQLRDLDDE